MPWIVITEDTLNEAKVAALIRAASTAARAVGQAERVPGIIQGVVNEVRRKVSSCPSNRVDADTTKIPESLRDLTVDLIIARLKKVIEEPLTEDEADQIKLHAQNLNRIAECKDVVDQPDDAIEPEVERPGPGVTLIRPNSCPHPFSKLGSS